MPTLFLKLLPGTAVTQVSVEYAVSVSAFQARNPGWYRARARPARRVGYQGIGGRFPVSGKCPVHKWRS